VPRARWRASCAALSRGVAAAGGGVTGFLTVGIVGGVGGVGGDVPIVNFRVAPPELPAVSVARTTNP